MKRLTKMKATSSEPAITAFRVSEVRKVAVDAAFAPSAVTLQRCQRHRYRLHRVMSCEHLRKGN
jgi:hypothetical protein